MSSCGKSPFNGFGDSGGYLKFYQGNLVAVEGSSFAEKLVLENIRIPYKQILKSRVVLKEGQNDYLLNHLGLGDNATFLAIAVSYDPNSKIEEDNYLTYYYFSDPSKRYPIGKLLMLSGNSTHRIEQIYITNPNPDYKVILDVMVGIIDNNYSYFAEEGITVNNNITYSNLEFSDLITWTPCETIALLNQNGDPQLFMKICDITAIQRCDKILVLNDKNYGTVYLDFISEQHAIYAQSLLSYQLENPCSLMQTILFGDNTAPVITFNDNVYPVPSQIPSTWNGTDLFTSTDATDFESTLSLSTDDNNDNISSQELKEILVNKIRDNVDGNMDYNYLEMSIKRLSDNSIVSNIVAAGEYSITFDLYDLVGNHISPDINIHLTITI